MGLSYTDTNRVLVVDECELTVEEIHNTFAKSFQDKYGNYSLCNPTGRKILVFDGYTRKGDWRIEYMDSLGDYHYN